MKKEKLGLVFSGGSAYGFAHIGVLKVLEENGIKPDIIVGTSMGAIIGGLYSAGMTIEEMCDFTKDFSRKKIIDFSLFTMFKKGLLHGDKVVKLFKSLVGDKNIEDCKTQFACVASDLSSGNEVIFDKGNLVNAMRASMSVPGIFEPVIMDDMVLVDGGVSNNLPVNVARSLGATKVIAVDVCSYYRMQNYLKSTFDIITSASNLTIANYVKMQQDKGDVYIRIDQPNVSFDKFSAEEVANSIVNGEIYTREIIEPIKALLN